MRCYAQSKKEKLMSWRMANIGEFLRVSGLVLTMLVCFSGLETRGQDSTGALISVTDNSGAHADLSTDAATDSSVGDEYKPLPYFQPILGLGVGFLTYFGDLAPFQPGNRITDNLAFDFSISTRTNKYITLELYFLKGKFTVDEQTETRNLNFQTRVEAGGLSFSHNFMNYIPEESRIHPYMSVGIEGFNFNSKGDTLDANGNPYYYWSDGTIRTEQELGTNTNASTTERDFLYESDLREANLDGLDRYSQFSFAVPVGVGVQYRINRRLVVDLGTEMHFTFTDNLDNVNSYGSGVREGSADLERFLYTSIALRYNIGQDVPEPPEQPEDTCLVDDDGDGVNNCIDECPDTPDSVAVDSVGCPTDTIVEDSVKTDSLWTVLLGKYGPGEFPTPEFINQVLSIPDVWTEVVNDTTYYINKLYDNPEEAEVQRLNITSNTDIKDSKVILWKPMIIYNAKIDQDKVNSMLDTAVQLSKEDVFFRVQIGAFSRLIPSDFFKVSDVVMIPGKDGLFKYVTGNYKNDYDAAEVHKLEMIDQGFYDAFIVVYRGGERVTLADVGITRDEENLDSAGVSIPTPEKQGIMFKIQIYASKDPIYMVPVNFKGLENVEEYEDDGLFKYTYGGAPSFQYASDVLLNQMRRIGYKDSFVVVFLNGKRITLDKAFELEDQND
jgi:hypothetical protein